MIESAENTNPSEHIPQSHTHFWAKLTIVVSTLILFVWLIFYFFSSLLFKSPIKQAFSNLTQQNYSLSFEDLKINLFSGKIIFYGTQIKPSGKVDMLTSSKIVYHSDFLMFQHIDIFAWRNKRLLKFKNILAKHAQLEIEKQNSSQEQQNLELPLSAYFKAVQVLNLKVSDAEINFAQEKDSIHIPALSFELHELRIDSLSDTVNNNRFHFSNIKLKLFNQQFHLPDNSHILSWDTLNLSTKKKYFEIDNLNIAPTSSANNQFNFKANIPKFQLEHFDFDSLFSKKQLLAKSFILDINRLNIEAKNGSGDFSFKEYLFALIKNNFNKIVVENAQIGINKSQIKLPNHRQVTTAGKSVFYMDTFRFDPKDSLNFSFADGAFTLNNLIYDNLHSKQKLLLEQVQLNYENQSLSFVGLNYISDSSASLKLQLKEVHLEQIDWIQLLNADKLIADTLHIKGGDFIQLQGLKNNKPFMYLNKIDSVFFPVFHLIKIKNIQIQDWNYRLSSKGLEAKNMSAQLRQFQLPGNLDLAFGAFSAFDTKISQLSWVSEDQRHHYLAKGIELSSETQKIHIQQIQSFPRWKSLINESLEEKAHFKLFAENIKMTTQKPFYKLGSNDTLAFSNLSIDSLNLKQFGKSRPDQKLKSAIPPIYIFSFELHKAEFSAYNDSSFLNRLAEINGIHIMGDSLLILNDGLPYLSYKHLLAITKNGFYLNKARGLSFNFEKLDFNSKEEMLDIYQIKTELNSENNEKSSQYQLNSKLLQIKGIDHNMFLQHNSILAQEFKLNAPTIISKISSNKKQAPTDFRHLFSTENLQKLPHLEFDRFIIRDFTWLATYKEQDNTSVTSFKNANFEANNFRLSPQSYKDPERIFFSKSIEFQIEKLRQHFQNRNYFLMIDRIGFSSLQKQLNFIKIQFYTLQKTMQNNYNFTIDRISLNEINFGDYQRDCSLSIDSILIQKPITKLRLFGFDENSKIKNLNTLELYPFIKPYFSLVNIDAISVRNMTLDIESPKKNSSNTYNLGHLDFLIQNLKIDSTSKAFENNHFFYAQNTLVHLRDYSAQMANGLYRMKIYDLRMSTLNGKIEIDTFYLKPQYNYVEFAKHVAYQTDRFDVKISAIKLSGIDFQDALFRQKYRIQRAEFNRLIGEAFRDGLYPRRANYFPSNPIQKLLALPISIQVDSLMIKNSYFAYKELGKNTNEPGHIFFDDLNLQILNVTNNPDFIKFGGNTTIHATTQLMGKSKLSLDVDFPLLDQGKSFSLYAHLNRIEMDDLEPILRPLALIQARSGTIKSIELSVEANDDYAFGNMLMYYDNMKVDVLNKSMKKGFFGSLFANAMIKTENPSYLIPRKGPIYFERNKMRSIFNYWAEIGILGMKTSMGLADRRTAKKVKKLKRK